jgi:hypothetical protein
LLLALGSLILLALGVVWDDYDGGESQFSFSVRFVEIKLHDDDFLRIIYVENWGNLTQNDGIFHFHFRWH